MAKNCSWIPYPGTKNAFKDIESDKCPFPIFDFSFINHLSKTIVLKSIRLRKESLYSGLHGFPRASVLKPLCKYMLNYNYKLGENILLADPPISVPPGQAFRFQVQVSISSDGEHYAPDGRGIFYFSFDFNNDITVVAPNILLNTENDNNFIELQVLN